jgi:glycine cleavage system transcriptional repressor
VPHVALTAVGADRPGIVAAVTKVLVERGCNLEDASMAILRGHFAMMLVVDVPAPADAAGLEAALGPVARELELVVTVRPIADVVAAGVAGGESWTVSVYGADRPGIVHGVAALMAELGVNIVDLTTRVIGPPDEPVYVMLLDVTVPPGVEEARLRERLERRAGELAVDCSLHRSDADIL